MTGIQNRVADDLRHDSGSYIMSCVLAQKQGWLQHKGVMPFETVVCGPFKPLRDAVNSGKADFFMWEHFTTKRWFDSGELKRVGEVPTPWNAWYITAAGSRAEEDPRIRELFLPSLEKGISEFQTNTSAATDFIAANMEYSKDDAEEWYKGVTFASPEDLKAVNSVVIEDAVNVLDMAGVMGPHKAVE